MNKHLNNWLDIAEDRDPESSNKAILTEKELRAARSILVTPDEPTARGIAHAKKHGGLFITK